MKLIALLLTVLGALFAQTPPPNRLLGTVTAIQLDASKIELKLDNGSAASVAFTASTILQRVGPGEKDLKKAEPCQPADIAVGDRVLASFAPGATDATRIIVMSAKEIDKRNEADRLDWTKRGISGVVAAKNGSEITLRMRSFQGERQATVTVGEKATFRRYAPDSVKFADAKNSSADEINVGDQLRARGQKSEDGLKVTAEDLVFGTFVTKAGTITAINSEAREITVKDLATSKPLVIKLTADSQLKKMPSFPMGGGTPGGGAEGGARPAGAGGPPQMPAGRPGGAPDMAQMFERMPATKFEDLKAGETIVVSSTKGAKADQITAIMILTNADMLIQMASMQTAGANRPAGNSGGLSMGMPSLSGGLDLPGMVP